MKFGACVGVDKAQIFAEAGYDYIELSASGELVPDEDEASWAEKRGRIEALPLPTETFNLFIRGLKVVGPDVEPERLERYVHTTLMRAEQVGGKVIVFGSGGMRRIPPGYTLDEAEADVLRFLNYCADAYEKTGVLVVVEPLNQSECNFINTVAEGAALVRQINRPGVRNLADTYHMEKDDEPLDAIVRDGDVLAHCHTADTERLAPGTGVYDHVTMFRTLREAGYDARLSIECKWNDIPTEAGTALAHLRNAYRIAQE